MKRKTQCHRYAQNVECTSLALQTAQNEIRDNLEESNLALMMHYTHFTLL